MARNVLDARIASPAACSVPLAEQGDAEAQISLGIMYDYGRGVPEDDTEAVKWYRKAAEQGVAKAQYNLGVMYTNGARACSLDNAQLGHP